MLIEAPFKLRIVDDEAGLNRRLLLDFPDEFRILNAAERAEALRGYISTLRRQSAAMDEGTAERRGMLVVLQIAEQLLPHIAADEIALEETIVIELGQEISLAGFLAEPPASRH